MCLKDCACLCGCKDSARCQPQLSLTGHLLWPHVPVSAKTHAHGFLQIPVANFIQSKEHVSLAVVLERTYVQWTREAREC